MMKKKLFLFIIVLTVAIVACSTDDNPVPERQVDFYINFNNAQYSSLQNPGGWCYVGGGYNGIFIYNFDNTTFFAYDRSCTFDCNHAPLVYDGKSHCLCHEDTLANCNSRFNVILKGAVQSGDAKFSLREYKVLVYDGRLRVINY